MRDDVPLFKLDSLFFGNEYIKMLTKIADMADQKQREKLDALDSG